MSSFLHVSHRGIHSRGQALHDLRRAGRHQHLSLHRPGDREHHRLRNERGRGVKISYIEEIKHLPEVIVYDLDHCDFEEVKKSIEALWSMKK